MEFFRDTNVDFMKYRRFWIVVSLALVAVGVFMVFIHRRLNVGIDFTGGTQLILRFRERPDVDRLRSILEQAGVGEAQIQRLGADEEHEVIVRTPIQEGTEEGSAGRVLRALEAAYSAGAGSIDLNQRGVDALTAQLLAADPDGRRATEGEAAARAHYEQVAEAILAVRREHGLITSWDQLAGVEGVSAQTVSWLGQDTRLGGFAVLSSENVGPQVGAELRRKGLMAVAWSLVGMLIYIWIRFELRFGVGAIMATVHDVLVTLGLFTLAGFEFNLTTIAAFLTLIGYSVNDTVVVFDRVRENLRKRPGEDMIAVMNKSINQTLSRTILTGGTTILACAALIILGGEVLRGFAFILTVGVIVGTYSSIYVASPFTLLWEQIFGARRRRRSAGAPTSPAKPAARAGGAAQAPPSRPSRGGRRAAR